MNTTIFQSAFSYLQKVNQGQKETLQQLVEDTNGGEEADEDTADQSGGGGSFLVNPYLKTNKPKKEM